MFVFPANKSEILVGKVRLLSDWPLEYANSNHMASSPLNHEL